LNGVKNIPVQVLPDRDQPVTRFRHSAEGSNVNRFLNNTRRDGEDAGEADPRNNGGRIRIRADGSSRMFPESVDVVNVEEAVNRVRNDTGASDAMATNAESDRDNRAHSTPANLNNQTDTR